MCNQMVTRLGNNFTCVLDKTRVKLFPNFTSSPFDYLLIFWVTNYVHKKRFFKIVYGNKDSKLKKRLTKRTVRKVLIF